MTGSAGTSIDFDDLESRTVGMYNVHSVLFHDEQGPPASPERRGWRAGGRR